MAWYKRRSIDNSDRRSLLFMAVGTLSTMGSAGLFPAVFRFLRISFMRVSVGKYACFLQ